MTIRAHIDIKENELLKIDRDLLEILLKDMTTGGNLLWATDNYAMFGERYSAGSPITAELITGENEGIIKPRVKKSKEEQQRRVRQKAEVFTPVWICNQQNNIVDEAWFGRMGVFESKEKICFPTERGKSWRDYVLAKRLEISCGEAPYLASRYDAVTGDYIEVPDRIGLLDRKLRVTGENATAREEWLSWAYTAVQSIYGFDWQGDNVLLARENLLFTVAEHYEHIFGEPPAAQDFVRFAEVIAWNVWQMDGLKFIVPNSCHTETKTEETLFETTIVSKECEGCKNGDIRKHNGTYCVIKDWETGEIVRFVDIIGMGE
ncbi:MAG: restriction endonuclease subunit M [Treponemataceae bacterium]|nr:restriction endonuclease subunit M [Treponemataceae bacterium]